MGRSSDILAVEIEKWKSHTLSLYTILAVLSVGGCGLSRLRGERAIAFWTTVAEELPDFTNFRNHIQIKVGHHDFVFIPAGLGDDFPPRIAEVALAIKFADAPGLLNTHSIDGAHKVTVRHGMRRLLKFPQIFGKTGNGCRRIEHDLRPVQSENARTLRKMPVVANVDADPRIFSLEHRISKIARE